jgi:hypothetical protein
MVKWDLDYLNGMVGYHLDSEPHMRIQVLDVPVGERDLWQMDHGELLLISINGNCIQAIWAPGLNPCKKCWEIDNKFYSS